MSSRSSKSMVESGAKSFRASLERMDSPLKWVIIRVPLEVAKIWGTRGRLPVKGEINGFAFRTSLFPSRQGGHIMIVNKRMQAGGKAAPGSVAEFLLEPDSVERVIAAPAELKRAFDGSRSLARWFEQLNYSTRKEIARWITEVKSAEARARRASQIAERLLATMQAERELPPIMQAAFARHPRARQGWARMSPARRRMHLLAIFYYRDPESRARRLAKAVEDAARLADNISAPAAEG